MNAFQSIFRTGKYKRPTELFQAVAGLHLNGDRIGANNQSDHAAWWEENIPVDAGLFYELFARNFADPITIDMDLTGNGFNVQLSDESQRFSGVFEYLKREDPVLGNLDSSLIVQEPHRGRGIGKNWIRSQVEFLILMGDPVFKFCAMLENGGYSWARSGAHLDLSPLYGDTRQYHSHRLMARLDALRHFVPADEYGRARAYCRLINKDDPRALASIDCAMGEEMAQDVSENKSKIRQNLIEFFDVYPHPSLRKSWDVAADEMRGLGSALERASAQKRNATLGEVLLSQVSWPAKIDLNNRAQMERVEKFVGGWRTIEPV